MSIARWVGVAIGVVKEFSKTPQGKRFLTGVASGARQSVRRRIRDRNNQDVDVDLPVVPASLYTLENLDGTKAYYAEVGGSFYHLNKTGYVEKVLAISPNCEGPYSVNLIFDQNGTLLNVEEA